MKANHRDHSRLRSRETLTEGFGRLERVQTSADKVLLATVFIDVVVGTLTAAYFASPLDPMPEVVLGPLGYLDDILIFACGSAVMVLTTLMGFLLWAFERARAGVR